MSANNSTQLVDKNSTVAGSHTQHDKTSITIQATTLNELTATRGNEKFIIYGKCYCRNFTFTRTDLVIVLKKIM